MSFFGQQSRGFRRVSIAYAVLWAIALIAWRIDNLVPTWLVGAVSFLSLPLGIAWIGRLRRYGTVDRFPWAVVGTLLYPAWWQFSILACEALGLSEFRGSLVSAGTLGLFTIGLLWMVWWLERATRRIEMARIVEAQSHDDGAAIHPYTDESSIVVPGRRIWNPIDPAAWYYGREGQKLKQSTLAFMTYGLLFWLASVMSSQIGGCSREYEMPAGGGQQKTLSQAVQIKKVVRKKFVVNPFSSIKFEVPPIDDIKLQLQEVTAHQYTIGYGEGTGAGFAGGTSKGKVRLIRLEYDGGDWDLNFGIGGDNNMLLEYGLLTAQKTADKTESIRVSQLASYPREKAPPVVFLTGQKNLSLSKTDIKTLREYLIDKHGMLFASSGSAHFHNQFVAVMNSVLPEVRPVHVPLDDVIHRVPFAVPFLPYVVPHGGRDALGWSVDGRWLVYYHPGDISDAWADGHAGVAPDVYNGCFQLGANVINYGHVEYSKWLSAKAKSK